MKKWVCRLSIVCCLCLFFTSVKAQLSLGGLGDILNSSTVNKVRKQRFLEIGGR